MPEQSHPRHDAALLAIGVIAGASLELTRLAGAGGPVTASMIVVRALVAAHAGAAALWLLRALLRRTVARRALSADLVTAYRERDTATYAAFLLPVAGAAGVQLIPITAVLPPVLFALLQAGLLSRLRAREGGGVATRATRRLAALFLVSGFAALIYQVVWQRALFAAFGVNTESVTLIVAIFMFGLGLGALLGGRLTRRFDRALPAVFVATEVGIGLFGLVSLPLIARVAGATQTGGLALTAAAIFALLAVPTILMGATLPVLVAWVHRRLRSVGRSVALLYAANTFGSAIAAVLTADVLFAFLGLAAATRVAAGLNLGVAAAVWWFARTLPEAGTEAGAGAGSAGEVGTQVTAEARP